MTRREDQRRSTGSFRQVDKANGPKKIVREWWDFLGHIDDILCYSDKDVKGSDHENQSHRRVRSMSFLGFKDQVPQMMKPDTVGDIENCKARHQAAQKTEQDMVTRKNDFDSFQK